MYMQYICTCVCIHKHQQACVYPYTRAGVYVHIPAFVYMHASMNMRAYTHVEPYIHTRTCTRTYAYGLSVRAKTHTPCIHRYAMHIHATDGNIYTYGRAFYCTQHLRMLVNSLGVSCRGRNNRINSNMHPPALCETLLPSSVAPKKIYIRMHTYMHPYIHVHSHRL